ncbi:MAG: hypothetical protein KF708_03330 [Pirellulales bacterium]|nr:hypothetical protein [Pirellulales bacterium]
MDRRWFCGALTAALLVFALVDGSKRVVADDKDTSPIDLTKAQLIVPQDLDPPARKAVEMLVDEVWKRSGVRWSIAHQLAADSMAATILVGSREKLAGIVGVAASQLPPANAPSPAEGYTLRSTADKADAAAQVIIAGNDSRGVLFGVGHLLRSLEMRRGSVTLPLPLNVTTAPAYPIRGHQLGYRPKTNSYDAWDLPQWEQYIRDLAIFGANAIELIPPRSDDDDDGPHFPRPKLEMMAGMSQLAADYGLDVWIWYPALDGDYSQPEVVERSLQEWGEVLGSLPRVDAIMVPTGDPGDSPPRELLALLEKQSAQLRKLHPGAQTWISVQSFTQEAWDDLMKLLAAEPEWLAGVVYGPQTRVSLPKLRAALPSRYPIRRYPDITHSMRCEYPVPDWDLAYARTLAREPINPRPQDEATIFRAYLSESIGFITYSEGCNDDVNKAVWSILGWDPEANVGATLRDFGRYFIGPDMANDFAQGLLALEQNWRGPLLVNDNVLNTLAQFQDMERRASPAQRANWRFQQALYRAYYDAYLHRRLTYETLLEEEATAALATARTVGSAAALDRAEAILSRAVTEPVAADLRARVYELAEALFQSIRMQLSVERYQAIDVGRGASLDTIDVPLNNRLWLAEQFAEIRLLEGERERLEAIDGLVHWTDPGPGGFYDDTGNPQQMPHVVREDKYAEDPGFLEHTTVGFHNLPNWRLSWCTHVDGLYDTQVKMHYPTLDPQARYKVRVVYGGENRTVKVQLATDDGVEIHPYLAKPNPLKPLEFDIPPAATALGSLTLVWTAEPGRGGPGRGCQIAEVWLIKVPQ